MIFLFLAVFLISNFLSLKYNLHIFQLNYYMPDTQIKWTFKNKWKFLGIFTLNIISIIGIIYLEKIGLIIASILTIINISIVIERNVKKKIVFTNRIIRMLAINYIILLILGIVFKDNINILIIIYLAISSIYPLYIIIIDYINKPINILINKYYINDAKKILNVMPNLKIIAVTGSYGKTSTKNYLAKIISSKYNVLYTPGNFNTLLGITRTIRTNLKPTHEVFICEIGIDRVRSNG